MHIQDAGGHEGPSRYPNLIAHLPEPLVRLQRPHLVPEQHNAVFRHQSFQGEIKCFIDSSIFLRSTGVFTFRLRFSASITGRGGASVAQACYTCRVEGNGHGDEKRLGRQRTGVRPFDSPFRGFPAIYFG
ncbi:hypothetical protein AHAS_Ahas08G0044600 [Arachis hypogaea]